LGKGDRRLNPKEVAREEGAEGKRNHADKW